MHPSGSSIAASAALGLLVIALSSARASALSCTVDADCGPSSSVCTMNFCIGGICAHADLLGDPCTDFDACTLVEHCFIGCKPVGAKPGCQLLGGDGPGAVPPSRNALGCEVEATRAARALAGELLRCRNRAARAELELTSRSPGTPCGGKSLCRGDLSRGEPDRGGQHPRRRRRDRRRIALLRHSVDDGAARGNHDERSAMPDVDRQFELRQLLKAYRRGLISDEVFEEQLRDIQLDGAATDRFARPARTYRVRERTFTSERAMLLHFLDEFRAGETFGGEVFAAWCAVATDPRVRGGLEVVREREAMHGRLLARRLAALGGEPRAELPEKFRNAACARLGSREIADADKIVDFMRRLPDPEAAVAPIREVIAQIEEDCETRALLESVLEDEAATVRWFHATGELLGVAPPAAQNGEKIRSPGL
jgi:hypothetical protein